MTPKEKKEWAQELLRQKEKELGRLPKKDDFEQVTLSRIKAFLGPWPRALEAAGLKTVPIKAEESKKRKKSGGAKRRTNALRNQEKSQSQKGENK